MALALLVAPSAAVAAPSGGISGSVKATVGGAGIEGVEVCAFAGPAVAETPGGPGGSGGSGPTLPCATTDATGKYAIGGLAAGVYEVYFHSPHGGGSGYLPEFYPDASSYPEAEPVMVNGTSTRTGIDATLKAGGSVSGRVKDAATEGGLAGVEVCAYSFTGGNGCADTGADGTYSIGSLTGGSYTVSFRPTDGEHVFQYYEGTGAYSSAKAVQVAIGTTASGIDARLERGATVSGTVVAADTHAPIAEALVCGLANYSCAWTGTDGTFSISGLPAGQERFAVESPAGNYAVRVTAPVTLTTGGHVTGFVIEAQPGARITGTITDASTSGPLAGATVCAMGISLESTPSRCSVTGADGKYSIEGLTVGEFHVEFYDSHETRYYDEASSYQTAKSVSVQAGGTVAGIDGKLNRGGEITGTVTDAGGHPIAGIDACAYEERSGYYYGHCALTGPTGSYSIGDLTGGEYRVAFFSPEGGSVNYVTQYYDGSTDFGTAAPVTVGLNERRAGIDARMQAGGWIEGLVTAGGSGEPLVGIRVCAQETAAECGTTGPDGRYRLAGLPTGKYIVGFERGRFNYVSDVYGGVDPELTQIEVAVGHGTAGIDAQLMPGAEVRGTVTSEATGEPLSNVGVTTYPRGGGGGRFDESTYTGIEGHYVLRGLPAGEYDLEFNAHSNEYSPQLYDGRNRGETPDPLSLGEGTRRFGVDAALTGPPPSEISPPTISGESREGKTLTEGHGTWTGNPTSYEYRWLRCEPVSGYCLYIPGATEQTYTLEEADAGHTIKVEEIASNKGGRAFTVASEPTVVVVPRPPVSIASPSVVGTAQQGQALFEEPGQWRHEVSELDEQWLRCDDQGNGCEPIAGAEESEYMPVAADVGHRLRVRETAINAGGASDPATSSATELVVPPVPTEVSAPTIGGSAKQSRPLVEGHGQWTYGPTSFEYQWLRCDESGSGCEPIGATGAEYMPVAADVGHRLRVRETAINAGGASEPAQSDPTAPVLPTPPVAISPPSLSGTAQQGETLTEASGSWTNEPTSFEYGWLRCDTDGESCAPIAGAEAADYVPVAADVGHRLRVSETAINAGGPGEPSRSDPTAVVVPPIPTNETVPTIPGRAQQGRPLTEANGRWTYEPSSYSYRWLRCDERDESCAPIDGQAEQTYTPTVADVGHVLEVEETATNAGGTSEPVLSTPTAPVEAAVPVATAPPTIVGQAQKGLPLVEQHGSWTNEPTSYAYRWLRCDAAGNGCAAISGAVDPTYKLTGADIGHTVKVEEVASNAAGAGGAAVSTNSSVVAPIPLSVSAGERIETTVGAPVHFDGSGSGPAAEIDAYRWQFGDGAEADGVSQSHTYTAAGDYTVVLTVSRGGERESASVTVNVVPVPGHQASVTVTDRSGAPLAGATVLYIGPGGERIEGAADGDGTASLSGLPEGTDAVYVYKDGYQPAVGHVIVSGGGGEATVALESGALAASTLKSHEMTLSEIEAAGIDVTDPANQHVYEFEVRLAFLPEPDQNVTFSCYINEAGEFVGSCGGGGGSGGGAGGGDWGGWGGSGGGPGCTPHACYSASGGIVAVPSIVEGHPVIQWLILRGKAAVLKQFFQVTEVIQNLSPQPFEFAGGTATLDVPSGMSLAPTAAPQAATQSVGPIAGEGSAEVNWIVRGDEPGLYPLAAEYHSTLEPLAAPVDLEARLASPLKVWSGAAALELHVDAEAGTLAEGRPYRVQVKVTNKADVAINNIGVEIFSDVHSQFIFQPGQEFSRTIAELGPGETISVPLDILVPDAPSDYPFNPNLSSIHFVGEEIHPGEGVTTLPSAPVRSLVASDESASRRVRLEWEPDPHAEGYEIYSTPTIDTPFSDDPEAVRESPGDTEVTRLPADATEAFAPYDSDDPDRYYAVSTIVGGTPTLDHLVALSTTGSGADDWGYCFEADAETGLDIGSANGSVCLVRSGDASQAYLLTHHAQGFTMPPDLTHLTGVAESLAHDCVASGSASIGAIAFEGPEGEDPGLHHYATVTGSVGVSIPGTAFGGGVTGKLMQALDRSTFGIYYGYNASAGVGCLNLPVSFTADTEPDYQFDPHQLSGAAKDQALSALSNMRNSFTHYCLNFLFPEGQVPGCSLAAIPRIGKPAIDLVKSKFPDLYLHLSSDATSPPEAPTGIGPGDWHQATSNENTGFTTADAGDLKATAKGIGAIGVGPYGAEPQGLPILQIGTSYFDVKVSKDSIFGSVVLSDCDIGSATSVKWWDSDASAWKDVSDVVFGTTGSQRCATITIGQDSSPSLSQLTGTVFGAVPPVPTCAAAPTIARQPADAAVTAPAEATFSVAEGPVPSSCAGASIQWQRSSDGGGSWSVVAGATASVLRLSPTAPSDSGVRFRAVLSNAHGGIDSAAATLTVGAEPTAPSGDPGGAPPTGEPTTGGGGGNGGGVGGAGGGASPGGAAVSGGGQSTAPTEPAGPKSLTCKRGFQKKKVKGIARCVKAKHAKKKAQPKHPAH